MRDEPIWLAFAEILAFHEMALTRHGGLAGLRDEGHLRSALDRPENLFAYERAPIPLLAAAYAEAIAKNHPFADGNKRTALTCLGVFLEKNGFMLVAPEEQVVTAMLDVAAGRLSRDGLARWVMGNTESDPGSRT